MAGVSPVLVEIPYRPRPLQRVIHAGMDTYRFGVVVCHRRFGKTVLGVNHLERGALRCDRPRPRFAYIAPTYKQAKAVAWDYVKYFGRPVVDHAINESELRIDFASNHSQVRLFGADNPDSLRGLYFDGVVLDEYGLMPPGIFSEVVRPTLADRGGWALFIGTPNGKNQFYDVVQQAQSDPSWFFAEYRASQTQLLSPAELASARGSMTADEYAQEFECSFEASVKGAVFAREVLKAREDGRITRVPYDPALPVDTDWDLGVGDATAIWFSQTLFTGEVRVIDYYESSGVGLAHYKQVLESKDYAYQAHWAPHDIEVREMSTGRSRLEAAGQLGIHFVVSPKVNSLEDGIHAVRMLLPRCWFDKDKTQRGVEALQHYRWDYNSRIHEFKHLPVHDWASHGADAFRGLAYRHATPRYRSPEKIQAAETRKAQRDFEADERPAAGGRYYGRGFRGRR
jgi:phage terminase large subunit